MPTKILAIDDSKTMRLGIKITFAAEDAEVVAVSKGSEAVARARQMGADVVLVDHKLAAGEPSGIEVCRLLRSDPSTKNIPIIFLVPARGGVSDADAKQSGANLVIAKPFETQELIDKVAEVVAAGSASVSKVAAKQAMSGRQSAGTGTSGRVPSPGPSPSPASPSRMPATTSSQIPLRADAGGRPLLSPSSRPSPVKSKPVEAQARVDTEPVGFAPVSTRGPGATSNAHSAKNSNLTGTNVGASTGKIPIAIPIPFTSASAPSNSMLRRLEEAQSKAGSEVGGLDPKVAEALLQLSGDVIERVVWEVVPEMAEIIIREKAQNQG